MAPISNASRLADFGTGIGTQGAGITIDNTNDRLGVGTDDPQSTFQVGVGCSISSSGVGTFADSVVVGSAFTANAQGITVVGTVTCTTLSGSGSGITGIAATDHVSTFDLVVAGISTFNDDVRVLAGGVDVTSGIVSATGLDIGTDGIDVDGQANLDELVVAGVATFSAAAYPSIDVDGQANLDELTVAGVATFSNTVDVNASVDATDVSAIGGNFTGILTATSFAGNGANLTGVGGEVDITSVLFL